MLFRTLLLIFFVSIAFSDDRVKIAIYAESLCPYCKEIITSSFKTAFEAKDINLISDLSIIPYGNAHENQTSSAYQFTCQHGPNECLGNLYEVCALNQSFQVGISFIICLEAQIDQFSGDFNLAAQDCSTKTNVNLEILKNCVNGELGNSLQHEAAEKTNSLSPPHKYVPWVVVDDKHDDTVQDQVANDMLGYICTNYKGTAKIDACQGRKTEFNFLPMRGKCWFDGIII